MSNANYNHQHDAATTFVPVVLNSKFMPKYGACDINNADHGKLGHKLTDCAFPSRSVSLAGSLGGGRARAPIDLASNKERNSLVERLAEKIPGLGIMFALCASFFLGSTGMLLKLTQSVHAIQVAVFRALIQMIIYGVIVGCRNLSLIPAKGERKYVLLRALLGGISITVSYHAIKLIPLGDATTIRFSLPIWTLIISYFVLGESCSILKVGAVCISICGVVLITEPDGCVYTLHLLLNLLGLETASEFDLHRHDFIESRRGQLIESNLIEADHNDALVGMSLMANKQANLTMAANENFPNVSAPALDTSSARQLEGCLLALTSSICLAMSLIALRLCKRTAAEVTICWLSTLSVLMGSVVLSYLHEWNLPDNWTDVVYIILNGVSGAIGQWFITNALKIEQSGVIALARTCDIQVAFLYSALLLNEQIRMTSIIGSILVSSGVIAVVVPKWLAGRNSNQDDHVDEDGNETEANQPASTNVGELASVRETSEAAGQKGAKQVATQCPCRNTE